MKILKSNVLQYFFEFFPDLPNQMRNTRHFFDNDNPSPFHMEDDVWSHTMIAYSHLNLEGLEEIEKIAACVSILCHDIGKVYTRASHQEGKVNFWGHAQASVQPTIDFSLFASLRMDLDDYDKYRLIVTSIYAVNNHYDVFRLMEGDISSYVNYDESLLKVLKAVCMADIAGQLKHSDTLNNPDYKDNVIFQNYLTCKEVESFDREVFVLCGVPGVGKDFIDENLISGKNKTKLSYDEIRVKLFEEKFPLARNLSSHDKYASAFEYCKDVDLNKPFEKLAKKAEGDIVVSNTNLTKKPRKGILNILKNVFRQESVKFTCVYVISDSETILSRNRDRKDADKTIPDNVVRKFMMNQYVPSMREGFDEVFVILNNYFFF